MGEGGGMTIRTLVITRSRPLASSAWIAQADQKLAHEGLRVVAGRYTKSTLTLLAVSAGR